MCCNLLALVCAYSLASFVVDALNILQIAPNYLDSNYDLSVRLANLLAERGHNVHFLIPLSKPDALAPSVVKMSERQNLKLQVCPLSLQTLEWIERPPPDTDFINSAPENIQQGGWSARHYKQSPAIVYVEAFAVIADIVKHGNCWEPLKRRHENTPFTVGLMDVWDFGALALFHALGIKNVVLTHNFAILSHMYDYMGDAKWPDARGQTLNYKQQILKNGVPEVFAATVNDSNIGKSDAFKAEHSASSLIFTTIYEQMNSQFKTLFKNDNFPSLKELFKNVNHLFINSRRPLDYALGTLPEKVKFIGGIDLVPHFQPQLTSNEYYVHKVFNENEKVIVFSMGTLLEPAKMPIDKFKTIVQGLGKLESMAVIWKYDAQQVVDHENRREFLKKNAPNVHIMPQFDTRSVLSNPKTRLLISECDSQSALDAVNAQKPLLCMPMFAEHFYVAEKLRRAGVAVVQAPHDSARITADALVDSIKSVDAKYAHFINKMKVLHDEIENEKIDPAELFLKAFEDIENPEGVEAVQEVQSEPKATTDDESTSFLYFSYGSNMLAERMHVQVPGAVFMTTAVLADFELCFFDRFERWHGAAASIERKPDTRVWGCVWRVPNSLAAELDKQESGYRRLDVDVTIHNDSGPSIQPSTMRCRTYQYSNPNRKLDRPSPHYRQVIITGALEHGLPSAYVEWIVNSFPTNDYRGQIELKLKAIEHLNNLENADNEHREQQQQQDEVVECPSN